MDVVYGTPDISGGILSTHMQSSFPQAASTIGVIAHQLNVPVHRIEYVIKTRGIQPVAIAGNCRIFAESEIRRIASELARIASLKEAQ